MSRALPSGMLVSALLRRVNDSGGIGMVRARGDANGGAILLILQQSGSARRLMERALDLDGRPVLRAAGPGDSEGDDHVDAYWQRRRGLDPDLWVVELDTPSAERFAAETICEG